MLAVMRRLCGRSHPRAPHRVVCTGRDRRTLRLRDCRRPGCARLPGTPPP